jgi:hypothetical protein
MVARPHEHTPSIRPPHQGWLELNNFFAVCTRPHVQHKSSQIYKHMFRVQDELIQINELAWPTGQFATGSHKKELNHGSQGQRLYGQKT